MGRKRDAAALMGSAINNGLCSPCTKSFPRSTRVRHGSHAIFAGTTVLEMSTRRRLIWFVRSTLSLLSRQGPGPGRQGCSSGNRVLGSCAALSGLDHRSNTR